MAELDLTAIPASSISTPSTGVLANFADSTLKLLCSKDDTGAVQTMLPGLKNAAVASVTGYAADTYLVGSAIALGPISILKAKSEYRCSFDVTKSAAGTATPIITVRFGTSGTTTDTARLTFTFNLQTAVADNGTFELILTVRNVGAACVIQGQCVLEHNLAVTGLGSVNPGGWQQVLVTSASFDSTVANSIIGVSVNGGASASWTTTLVQTKLLT